MAVVGRIVQRLSGLMCFFPHKKRGGGGRNGKRETSYKEWMKLFGWLTVFFRVEDDLKKNERSRAFNGGGTSLTIECSLKRFNWLNQQRI